MDLVTYNKNDVGKKKFRIASASEKVFARCFGHFLGDLVCLKSVFSDGQNVEYDRDTTDPHHFLGTHSHETAKYTENGDKHRESEWKIGSSTSRASQCSCC